MEKDELLGSGAEAASLFCRLYLNTRKEIPVRSSHMGLLILLVKSENPVTPMEAAQFFRVKKPMITGMVNCLEKGGYLIKKPSEEDRRSYWMIPTQKTVALVEETYGEYYKVMEALYDGMGHDVYGELLHLLKQANSILESIKE